MARVSTYINFANSTEEAFNFYKLVFGGSFDAPGIMRFRVVPPQEGQPAISDQPKGPGDACIPSNHRRAQADGNGCA